MKFIKHKFQSGDGFIGTKEERIILQKLIVEKGYESTSGFKSCDGSHDFYWTNNIGGFYLTFDKVHITNPIPLEKFKELLLGKQGELVYEVY
jgi:hypothetical protein